MVAEIRLALIQAGQKLSRHIKKEFKEADLERKLAHIEQFGPIIVEKLAFLVGAPESRKKKAEEGLRKLLGRDSKEAIEDLVQAEAKLSEQKKRDAKKTGISGGEEDGRSNAEEAPAPSDSKEKTKKIPKTTWKMKKEKYDTLVKYPRTKNR